MNYGNHAGTTIRLLVLLLTGTLAMLAQTAFADTVVPDPVVTPIPYDAGTHHHPFVASPLNLSQYGYVENEFQISGTANKYKRKGTWSSNGEWDKQVARADVPYTTRIIVRRPTDPAKFNGIVIVEWLNNTAFMDVDVIWAQSHEEMMREGFAWVGVTSQYFGVTALKAWDRARYGDLHLRSDALSYDIFSQAGQAVRSQPDLILGGLPIKGVIGAGESQSAIRLSTYVNAFQASATQVYDGILIYSRFPLASPLGEAMISPSPLIVHIRPDNQLKVLQLETEQDLFMFQFRLARQDDTDNLRTWEVAGTSHYDNYGVSNLFPQYRRDFPALANFQLSCKNSLNKIPSHYAVDSALYHMAQWVTGGEAPPHSPRIKTAHGKAVRDTYGNAIGGIRLPEMDAPTATNNFNNYGSASSGNALVNAFACPFLGNTVPFDKATLEMLYPTHQDYVWKFTAAADAALHAGFLLPSDYDEAVAQAQAAAIP